MGQTLTTPSGQINTAPKVTDDLQTLHKAILDGNMLLAEELARKLMDNRGTQDTFICNITEQEFGPLDMWHYMPAVFIPAKKPGQKYSLYKMVPHVDHMDLGDQRTLDVPIPSYDAAVDVCDKFNGHMGRGSFAGLFVIPQGRSTPTDEELSNAEEKLRAWEIALVREGDRYHDIRRPADISDLHRNAARHLGLKKAWLPENIQSGECPGCGENVKAGIVRCPHCHAILDKVKARELYPELFMNKETEVKAPVPEPITVEPSVFAADEDESPIQHPQFRTR